jgi:hypothetical protein
MVNSDSDFDSLLLLFFYLLKEACLGSNCYILRKTRRTCSFFNMWSHKSPRARCKLRLLFSIRRWSSGKFSDGLNLPEVIVHWTIFWLLFCFALGFFWQNISYWAKIMYEWNILKPRLNPNQKRIWWGNMMGVQLRAFIWNGFLFSVNSLVVYQCNLKWYSGDSHNQVDRFQTCALYGRHSL